MGMGQLGRWTRGLGRSAGAGSRSGTLTWRVQQWTGLESQNALMGADNMHIYLGKFRLRAWGLDCGLQVKPGKGTCSGTWQVLARIGPCRRC
jgi:hypothetical protein